MLPGSSSVSSSTTSAAANAAVEDLAWATRLVNAQNPLPENFTVKTTAIRGYDNREFDLRAAQSLEALLHDAEQDGNKLYLFMHDITTWGDANVMKSAQRTFGAFKNVQHKITSAKWLDNNAKVTFIQEREKEMLFIEPTPFEYGESWVIRVAELEIEE
ncbi:MAG: hypothetical protein RSD78_09280 [Oscillospiraceae bacterium]